jgi:K+/H+ antiporter YhaU regulatory subunit KhtT
MFAIFTLLIVITLSIIINRVATIALIHTGLPRESARFQARSALTGAGFTTNESESVVSHPVRRRIILILMLIGNAGIVTAISTLILTFVNRGDDTSMLLRVSLLISGTSILLYLSQSKWVDKRLSNIIDKFLKKYSSLKVQDYASLMHLSKDYRLAELAVQEKDWISEKTLKDAQLSQEGLLVLGVKRSNGKYIGAPRGSTMISAGDILIVYGRLDEIKNVDIRRKTKYGDKAHIKAIKEQEKILKNEQNE